MAGPGAYVALSNGVSMPVLGLGTYKTPDGPPVEAAVRAALEAGYRGIDTASFYGNEKGIGNALKQSGIARGELFIATKVWISEMGYAGALKAFEESTARLGTAYLDLYLIHWAVRGKYLDTWKALEELYAGKKVRAIGVCNATISHLEDIITHAETAPMVNQVEMHPLLYQRELADYCRDRNIKIESWAPLSRGNLFDHPLVKRLEAAYERSPAQILLRWGLQHGFIVIPKSAVPERIALNARVFDFTLSDVDMAAVDGLNEGRRLGPDPHAFDQ